jgi:hypothetical protein
MDEVCLVVRDEAGDWSGKVPAGMAVVAEAALSADPVSQSELEMAMTRFEPSAQGALLDNLLPGLEDQPHGAGLVVIDLVARLLVDSANPNLQRHGCLGRGNDRGGTEYVRFHLADEWQLTSDVASWRDVAEQRRRERAATPPRDHREIFYGHPLLEFIARETWAAFQRRADTARELRARLLEQLENPAPNNGGQPDRKELEQLADDDILLRNWPGLEASSHPLYEVFKNIHASWLTTPRDDLGGCSPRDVAIRHQDHIAWDLQHRREQWSLMGTCPPGLHENSVAFRLGGFGTHELVIYYSLVRRLLYSCWTQLTKLTATCRDTCATSAGEVEAFVRSEVPRLEKERDEWLETPDPELHLHTPRSIIHRERSRIPETRSGRESMVDPDCPCCQMLADLPGPMFWGLDDCNLDDEFAFDIRHATREQWEQERRKWDEFSRRCEAERQQSAHGDARDAELAGAVTETADRVWKTSYSSPESHDDPPRLRVFGIGCHLAELITDLRSGASRDETPKENQACIDLLNRHYGNLRDVLGGEPESVTESLVRPVVDRFTEALAGVAESYPQLTAKCEDLTRQVQTLG